MYNENKECKIDGNIFKIDIKTHLQLDIDLDEIRKRIINSDSNDDEIVYDIIIDYLDELEDYDDEKFDLDEDVYMALHENGYLDDLNSKSEENELETLKKENAHLKQQLSESQDNHGWDFHWDGKGSYEESYRCFYGSFS